MSLLLLATLTGDPELEAQLAISLSQVTDADLVLRCVDRVETHAVIRSGDVDALISAGIPRWLDDQTIGEALARGIRIVSLTDDLEEQQRMERLGSQVLATGATPIDVLGACREDRPDFDPDEPTRHALSLEARLIAVWGPKGSPGRTSIAVELAAEISKREPATLLIDSDLYGGDIAQLLGIVDETPTVVWATRMAAKGALDPSALREALRRPYPRGPLVLSGVKRPDLWAEVSDHGWRELISVARTSFKFVVCDVGFCLEPPATAYLDPSLGRNQVARETVMMADRVIAVCRGDALGVTNFLWSLSELQELTSSEPLILVNKARPRTARETKNLLKERTGLNVTAFVPERIRDFDRAFATGRPVVRSRRSEEIRDPIAKVASAVGHPIPASGFLTKLAGRA
jgi:MinD-like ATPase involved in chromosome partitioning or flagellar assembly